jgi:nitrate/nitrite transporter NarK
MVWNLKEGKAVRKRTVRNGMRLVMAALILIILASFYHVQLSDLFSLSPAAESRIYRLGMFWAAAIGGYGVVVTVFGFVFSPLKNDAQVRLLPIFLSISAMIFLFFYLLSSSIDAPARDEQRRVRPGETITI